MVKRFYHRYYSGKSTICVGLLVVFYLHPANVFLYRKCSTDTGTEDSHLYRGEIKFDFSLVARKKEETHSFFDEDKASGGCHRF